MASRGHSIGSIAAISVACVHMRAHPSAHPPTNDAPTPRGATFAGFGDPGDFPYDARLTEFIHAPRSALRLPRCRGQLVTEQT